VSHRVERHARNVLAGTLTNYALLAVTIALGAFLMPFTIGHLGKAQYGLWMLVASMTAYLQLLDLGYGNGVVRQITQADARHDEDQMNVILSTFMVVYGVLGMAALSVLAALAFLVLPRFPNLTAGDVRTAQWVLLILGLRVAVAFPMGVFGAVTTARQRFALTGRIAIALALVQGLVTWLVLRAGYGLIPLVSATTSVGLAGYVAYAAAARATFPGMRLSPARFSPQQVREVTSFSLYLFTISIAIHIGASVDNLIVGAYLGTSAVAVYTVALRLMEYQRQTCGQFSGYLFPLVVRFDAGGDHDAMRATLLDGTRLALGLVSGATIGLLAFGDDLVRLWMGPDFAHVAPALYVLAVAGAVMVTQGPSGTILLGSGRHRLVAMASVLEVVLNVAFSIALVTRFGLAGVALGTLLPYAILNFAILIPAACRAVGVPLRTFVVTVVSPAAIAALPTVAAAVAVQGAVGTLSVFALAGASALVGSIYVTAFLCAGLRRADRARYLRTLRGAAPALSTTHAAAS
jgi:O-antigen/teichoic acid export membrane protein